MEFLETLGASFRAYLQTNARSNEKLKILHKKIAQDLQNKFGKDYEIHALGINKEKILQGRYYDKAVDIAIFHQGVAVGGVAVKFVMSNYAQNANNYFEGMLGETANLRANGVKYFQIIIIPKHLPYFDREGNIVKPESFSTHNLEKYIALSHDTHFLHAPNKTLLALIKLPDFSKANNKDSYKALCDNGAISYSNEFSADDFGENVILNNYEEFLNQVRREILARNL